jgi:hypothetical protein
VRTVHNNVVVLRGQLQILEKIGFGFGRQLQLLEDVVGMRQDVPGLGAIRAKMDDSVGMGFLKCIEGLRFDDPVKGLGIGRGNCEVQQDRWRHVRQVFIVTALDGLGLVGS